MSEKSFYRAFEDRHRGSRELIKSRLDVYRSFIKPLIHSVERSYGIDLGCGRGEWLEILEEMGISGLGVDLDPGMLSSCSERGLKAIQGDAIAYLATLEDESQIVVSAFHMVEHISFDQLQNLVQEAHRVLKPGGLLIMETPNPENIMVATCSFYLDPTHTRPIPPDLLLFLTEFCNFSRSKILRLQEDVQTIQSTSLNLNHVLGGASPDYAVIAQKAAAEDIQSKCDYAFSLNYGVDTITIATNYSDQQNQKLFRLEEAESTLKAIYSSFSWRITRPLRWFGNLCRKFRRRSNLSSLKFLLRKRYFRTLGGVILVRRLESSAREFLHFSACHLSRKPDTDKTNSLSSEAQKIYAKLKAKA